MTICFVNYFKKNLNKQEKRLFLYLLIYLFCSKYSCYYFILRKIKFLQICGLALLTVGAIFYIKIYDVSSALEKSFPPSIPIFLIVIGAIIFIIAFFGCCGAIRDSHCMVVTVRIHFIIFMSLKF